MIYRRQALVCLLEIAWQAKQESTSFTRFTLCPYLSTMTGYNFRTQVQTNTKSCNFARSTGFNSVITVKYSGKVLLVDAYASIFNRNQNSIFVGSTGYQDRLVHRCILGCIINKIGNYGTNFVFICHHFRGARNFKKNGMVRRGKTCIFNMIPNERIQLK